MIPRRKSGGEPFPPLCKQVAIWMIRRIVWNVDAGPLKRSKTMLEHWPVNLRQQFGLQPYFEVGSNS